MPIRISFAPEIGHLGRRPRIVALGMAGLLAALAACDPDKGSLGRNPVQNIPGIVATKTTLEGVVTAKDHNGSLELGACLPDGDASLTVKALKAAHLSAIKRARSDHAQKCATTVPVERVSDSSDGPPASFAQATAIGDIIVRVETIDQGNMTTSYAWQDAGHVLSH